MAKKNKDNIKTEVNDLTGRESTQQKDQNIARGTEQDITENLIAAKGLEGKNIVDDAGEVIGKVQSVYIDPNTLNVKGISIDNGLFKGSDFIDSSYISTISEEAVVLFNAAVDRGSSRDYASEKMSSDESMGA